MLNGNPAVDIFNGIKLAASGELGVGVGEEEWGSGEREVLEDFVYRTDGMVDIIVSKFGEAAPEGEKTTSTTPNTNQRTLDAQSPIGSNTVPRPSDGVIFSGIGALTKSSLTRVSHWMEWVYRYGEDSYGVKEDPRSMRRRRRKKPKNRDNNTSRSGIQTRTRQLSSPNRTMSPGIPPPLVTGSETTPKSEPVTNASREGSSNPQPPGSVDSEGSGKLPVTFGSGAFMKLLTLGYGSSWGVPSKANTRMDSLRQEEASSVENSPHPGSGMNSVVKSPAFMQSNGNTGGSFIIGLRDDLEDEESEEESVSQAEPDRTGATRDSADGRCMLRTLKVSIRHVGSDGGNTGWKIPIFSCQRLTNRITATESIDEKDLHVVIYYVGTSFNTSFWHFQANLIFPAPTIHVHFLFRSWDPRTFIALFLSKYSSPNGPSSKATVTFYFPRKGLSADVTIPFIPESYRKEHLIRYHLRSGQWDYPHFSP